MNPVFEHADAFSQILSLLDQARDCGMNAVSITGGEPLIHPDFIRIVDAIFERDMFLFALMTNGSLLTDPDGLCISSLGQRVAKKTRPAA